MIKGTTDEERHLTELGQNQAELTGARLAELNLPLTYMVSSTMTRAQQTKSLIRPYLPETLEIKPDDSILTEGAPYPPEPKSRWNPESRYAEDGARIEAAFRHCY
jgi:serine/threonine-protein phosphatase PGAM5